MAPTTKFRRADGELKRSASTTEKQGFEAMLSFVLRCTHKFKELDGKYEVLRQAFKKRRINLFKPGCAARVCTPSRPFGKWIRHSMLRAGYDTDVQRRCLPIAHRACSKGDRDVCTIACEMQMLHWLDFVTSARLTLKPTSNGLGMFATKDLEPGFVICRGVLDGALWWPELETLAEAEDGKAAALFGPISLINSACKTHANAVFRRDGAVYYAEVDVGGIQAGGEVVVNYVQHGHGDPFVCPCCGEPF